MNKVALPVNGRDWWERLPPLDISVCELRSTTEPGCCERDVSLGGTPGQQDRRHPCLHTQADRSTVEDHEPHQSWHACDQPRLADPGTPGREWLGAILRWRFAGSHPGKICRSPLGLYPIASEGHCPSGCVRVVERWPANERSKSVGSWRRVRPVSRID